MEKIDMYTETPRNLDNLTKVDGIQRQILHYLIIKWWGCRAMG